MKRHPLDPVIQHQPTDHEQLSEVQGIDSPSCMILERYPRSDQQINRILRKHIIVQIELEVELPTGTSLSVIAILVSKSQAELNYFQKIDVALQRFVVKVRGVGLRDGTGYNPWEFRVHCHIGMSFDEFADNGHFLFGIFFPDVTNFQRFTAGRLKRITPNGIAVSVSRSMREGRTRPGPIVPVVGRRASETAARGDSASTVSRAEGRALHAEDAGHG
mmetsp:Transcript_57435/g.121881  ORF Transcript_57435/g.121881 Transcript_57435/m.121881 type:complete len:218 (+) Transcript_57435:590-1243(+)